MLPTIPHAQIRHYVLACPECGQQSDDDGFRLECPQSHAPALLRTQYRARMLRPRQGDESIFRYRDWLPIARAGRGTGRTAVYRSEMLGHLLGMRELWIAFNGYWPERGALLETVTFKELEAQTVLARLPSDQVVLTVPSSGNTGAAFAWACSREQVPCLVIVPGSAESKFRFSEPLDPRVRLAVLDDGDYPDAIALARQVSAFPPFQLEGGVQNVGRRDGLATVMLSAFEEMGRLPAYYFQAAGSGTGAIGAWEAAGRLRAMMTDTELPKIMLCQNAPFTPIYDTWRRGGRQDSGVSGQYRQVIGRVMADELTNPAPPYSVRGGLRGMLAESSGDVLVADNAAVRAAMSAFLEAEGIDIEPAAGVALACLRKAVQEEQIDARSVVLLNVTGGGRARHERDHALVQADFRLHLTRESLKCPEAVAQRAAALDQAAV